MKGQKGWFYESHRHSLAAKGIKTGRKAPIDRWKAPAPSLLNSDLKKYQQIGADLVKRGLITGFQIRDIRDKGLKGHKYIMYAHSNRQHLNTIMAQIREMKGVKLIKEFPRMSGYFWDNEWKVTSSRTKLYEIDTSKKVNVGENKMVTDPSKKYYAIDYGEAYIIIATDKPEKITEWIKENAIMGYSKKPIKASWEMPDIRAKNISHLPSFKKVYAIRKPIDSDTEFVTLVPDEKTKDRVMKEIEGREKSEEVLIQDVKGHSLYSLVKGKSNQ